MTLSNILMFFGIVVSAAVALLIADLQRKQMRQIELYRQDSSVGLVPPSILVRFVKSRWKDVLAYAGPLINLVVELSSSYPLSRLSVVNISLSVALIVANVVMQITSSLVGRLLNLIESSFEVMSKGLTGLHDRNERHLEITGKTVDLLDRLVTPNRSENDG